MPNTTAHPALPVAKYLLERYGPLMHGRELWSTLGYVSAQAFRSAVRKGTVPIGTFTIESRRGRFAKTLDVAAWLSSLDSSDEATGSMEPVLEKTMPP
ncbi:MULTISPECIES: hypothetical protein [Burkholderia cepacia complex]|jgi:hypothetical protein|uniref:Uncharacterized protein n=1 Tax=Burkholderia cenocepacia TaxID=95486 RepID=A0A1V2W7Z7_9BURK|nr:MULTISPECIES: hypothetical protein [Burkholderia cepacia complex]AIO43841.1 hypothetical protein DM42_6934 [Burkholderia cepacia]KGC05427.1 hypothetical protein DM44_6457 [Burkholderia cepacia]MBR8252018.1 hypothetical protein [Burkholderia cenocepacia]MBR8285564.1 hypothetical protein [Burkholderia cenocepacia]MBR8431463.1 hypothetical protein [Burkholderia cenocepacia]